MDDTLLSSSVTIKKYHELEADQEREQIADFIKERFFERYIKPLRGAPAKKHGFCTMAISCLMIEALESFWQGWANTKGKGRQAFRSFFKRFRNHSSKLGEFSENADDFYKNVRCGILHQAETNNGWRIRRDGPLFDQETKTINATKFHDELEKALLDYCSILKQTAWDSEIWINLKKKMNSVIENCRLRD